ncbi:MAG: hypothetical protein C4551_00570 [Bacillota bacterium]|nr:MAG: hypothetical protein C4551_00570 [Bacillota bacterium]
MANSFWRGLITGGLIGGLLGAMFAPSIKPEFRERVMERGRGLRKQAERLAHRARREVDEALEER